MRFSRLLLPAVAVLAGMAMAARPSQALTFDFSFTSPSGPDEVGGTVTGEITGLNDNTSNEKPTGIYLTSAPTALLAVMDPLPLNDNLLTDPNWYSQADTFSVSNGVVTVFTLSLFDNFENVLSSTGGTVDLCNAANECSVGATVAFTLSAVTASVPEPMTISLFGVGLAGLAAMRFRHIVSSPLRDATANAT
jgi:hypothetical protein